MHLPNCGYHIAQSFMKHEPFSFLEAEKLFKDVGPKNTRSINGIDGYRGALVTLTQASNYIFSLTLIGPPCH